MKILVKEIDSSKDIRNALAIRKKVFVIEQNVPVEIEIDKYEDHAHHYGAFIQEDMVGTARWRQTEEGIKLERFAVLNSFRQIGVGSALVTSILNNLPPHDCIYLNAQVDVVHFYLHFGFQITGKTFNEAGIEHQKMILSTK